MPKQRVLLVDDDANVLKALYRLIRSEKLHITCCESGDIALQKLNQGEKFDLVVSDQDMPGINGHEFLSKTKDILPHAKRIMLSAYKDFHEVVSSLNNGTIHKFLSKPWDNDKLLSIFHEILKDQINGDSLNEPDNNKNLIDDVKRYKNFIDHFELEISHTTAHQSIAILVVSFKNPQDILSQYSIENYYKLKNKIASEINAFFKNQYYFSNISDGMYAIMIPLIKLEDNTHDIGDKLVSYLDSNCKNICMNFEPEFICGISLYPEHGVSAEYLMRNALLSMFRCYDTHCRVEIYKYISME